ncbi:hypothetical protein P43SY_011322 [Pythium insidiosum]|uniref:Uncharacterized protein n=1 Tax=Pythium insidiosum TaxID=114742 RepID=A0AAD5LA69_PYTIN|nr:hypothetical protein P43SY_011322 [Pythium insidiosum]
MTRTSKAIVPAPPSTPSDDDVRRAGRVSGRRRLALAACVVIVVVQSLWAVAIPIKNVVVMPYPRVVPDALSTSSRAYDHETELIRTRWLSGRDVFRVVERVVRLALTDPDLRRSLEAKGDFAIDSLGNLLSPEDYNVVSQYYALVFQASELPAAGTVPRSQPIAVWQASTQQWVNATLTCSHTETIPGMRCVNPEGGVCDDRDWDLRPRQLTLTPVDLQSLTNNTGWTNKNSLLSFVTWTHNTMRALFTKKDWSAAVAETTQVQLLSVLEDGHRIRYDSSNIFDNSIVSSEFVRSKRLTDWLDLGYRRFESCFGSEFLLSGFFANYFALRLIEDIVVANRLYGTSTAFTALPVHNFSSAWSDIFSHDVHLTSGAGALKFQDERRTYLGSEMTRFTEATAALKKDRPMVGSILMGSSFRMLLFMKWYPNSYYSFLQVEERGDTVVADWRQVGGYHAGFNGFKFDFVRNTMGVFRLAERRATEGSGYGHDWFAQERELARWFLQHEDQDPRSLVQLVSSVWQKDLDALPAQGCREGLLRKVTQTVWIRALRWQPVLSHLVFMSMTDPDDPAVWFKKQMGVSEIVGETITGQRVSFPFSREGRAPITGSEWVLVPLLRAFLQRWNASEVVDEVMAEMDTTFLELIEVENGKMMFKDATHCHFGWATLGVTGTSSKDDVWKKTRARMRAMIAGIVDSVDPIYAEMAARVDVHIPLEYVFYNRKNNIFPYEGPPVPWRHSALGIGLLKLAVKVAPLDEEVMALRDALTCYDVLELRYLNVSTRCWAEPQNAEEGRKRYRSEGLRLLKFSMWSLGVVLNVIGAVVSLKYCGRVLRLWRQDRFSDLSITQALNLDIQALGMISFEGVVIMAFSSVPLILVYHLPVDSRFMPDVSEQPTTVFSECMVLLSLTWFIRLGIALGDGVIHLRYYNWWFDLLTSRVRYCLIAVLAVFRACLRVRGVDYDMGLSKLIASCVVSVVLGFGSVVASVWFDRDNRRSQDAASRLMLKHKLARNIVGVVAQFGGQWTQSGLVLEGWRALRVDGRLDAIVCGSRVVSLDAAKSDVAIEELPRDFLRRLQTGGYNTTSG